MDSLKQKVYIVGKGYVIELGNISTEELMKLNNLSEESRQKILNEIVNKIRPEFREWFGFCKQLKKHVRGIDCIRCAKNKNFKKIIEWEACTQVYLEKPPKGDIVYEEKN